MKREIKFRAWNEGKMIYQNQTIMTANNDQLWWFFKSIRKDAILMQFTGLQDKNGVDIYEGDIPKGFNNSIEISEISLGTDSWGMIYKAICVNVQYDDKSGHLIIVKNGVNSYSKSAKEIEIIGNIYENPELLNKEVENV